MELPCKDCVSGHILPGDPKGTFSEGAYFTKAERGNDGNSEKRALVLLTDSFGLQIQNPKILADSFANRLGCDVFVPDLFNGHPPINEHDLAPYIPDTVGQRLGLLDTLRYLMVIIRSLPGLLVNRPSVVLDRSIQFIERIKREKGYLNVGVVGYCYGGAVALGVATRSDLVNAVVACHPGPVNVGYISRATVPLAMMCSDADGFLSPAKRDRVEVVLRENSRIPSKLVVFPGTRHGFATRPNLGIPQVREGFEGAFEDTCSWFKMHLA